MNIINFAFPSADHAAEFQSPVRVLSRDGELWFIAKDVAQILGYRDAEKMVRNLDDDESGTHNLGIRSENGTEQHREVLIINESGLYSAILRSRRKEAKRFKKWVTSTVLPSIRQHGGYLAGQESLSPNLVLTLHKTIRENALPALRYYDVMTQHDHWKSPVRRQVSSDWAIQETALKFDLPVSLVEKLTDQGVSALCV